MKAALNQIDTIIQSVRPASRATLVQLCGDIDAAEVALLNACKLASNQWQCKLPDNPVTWLIQHGKKHIAQKKPVLHQHSHTLNINIDNRKNPCNYDEVNLHDSIIKDDILRLLFSCCHPILNQQAQIALTLHMISDLPVSDIARAFLVSEKNMEENIKQAKSKIKQKQINYEIPNSRELPHRLNCVLKTIFLIFNEGYQTNHNETATFRQLCEHAIRLARRLLSLFSTDNEVIGLLALLLFKYARFDTRMPPDHPLLTLEEQNKEQWNYILIDEARALLNNTCLHKHSGPYLLQATIAGLHCQGKSIGGFDWQQIHTLYHHLKHIQPTPTIRLNQIIAAYHAKGVQTAWQLLQELNSNQWLLQYAPYFVVKAFLLDKMHKTEFAISTYKRAKSLTSNTCEVQYIQTKIDQLMNFCCP